MSRNFQQYQYDDRMKQYGEITGDTLKMDTLDQGMPYRPTVTVSTDRYQLNDTDKNNPGYRDFDLYDEEADIDVLYHDPSNDFFKSNTKFSDVGDDFKILPSNHFNSMSQIINNFTFTFLQQFTANLKTKKSIILSPFNILQAFCLLYIGSSQATEKELRTYFQLPDKKQTFSNLYQINNDLMKTNVVSIMNLVCAPSYFNLNNNYLQYISKIGNFIKINPRNASNEVKKINGLISQSTNGMINNLISPDMITEDNALLIISTIYFYSKWKNPFNIKNTKAELFNGLNQRKEYMMMQSNGQHNYFEDRYNQVLELEYSDNVFVFGMILPKQQQNPEISITMEQFNYYISQLKLQEISLLKMPKFKYETKYSIDNLFRKYGMRQIFTDADISEIINKPNDKIKFYVGKIVHNAVIIVDENGTKAAAATAMNMFAYNSVQNSKPKINFIANHQFLYYIRHRPTNTIIFIGKFL
jgi:serpin B